MAVTVKPVPEPKAVKAKRDPRKEAMWQMTVSNMLTVAAYSFERRSPDVAKLFDMLNVDFILNFQRYMEEINGPVVRGELVHAADARKAASFTPGGEFV
jgi:hypothetical protein